MAYFCFRQHKRDPSRLHLPKSSHITPSRHRQSNSELFFLVGTLFTTCSHSYSQPRTSAVLPSFITRCPVAVRTNANRSFQCTVLLLLFGSRDVRLGPRSQLSDVTRIRARLR